MRPTLEMNRGYIVTDADVFQEINVRFSPNTVSSRSESKAKMATISLIEVFAKLNDLNLGTIGHQKSTVLHMCQGLNSHYFHIIGDGHQPNSRGLYTHYKDSY